jgi:acyl carrier protein
MNDPLILPSDVAEAGSVDPQFVFASDRYPEDLEVLPAWDSPDWVDLIMRLEEKLNIRISDRNAERLYMPRWTVRELVQRVVSFYGNSAAAT